jgi:hypothetical protein
MYCYGLELRVAHHQQSGVAELQTRIMLSELSFRYLRIISASILPKHLVAVRVCYGF